MNLTIDQGNTSTKIAVFYNDDLQYVARMEQLTATAVETLFQQFSIDKVIVSSVADNKKSSFAVSFRESTGDLAQC